MAEILTLLGIRKSFGGIKALKGVDFHLQEGEIHALLGENGAGKSTLIKIITGVHQADEGEILINGGKVRIDSPVDAAANGIAVIYQELSLINSLTVGENIFIGNEPEKGPKGIALYDRKTMYEKSAEFLAKFGIDIDPHTPVQSLRLGQKRIIEIVKALSRDARILLLDEPTTGMSRKEIDTLFQILNQLREKKVTMIYISHYLDEVFRICDRATVFRDGENIDTFNIAETTTEQIVHAMVGRSIAYERAEARDFSDVPELLGVRDFRTVLMKEPVSFSVRKGEILGITGIIGAGKSELAHSLFGAGGKPLQGELCIAGEPISISSCMDAKKAGMGFVPEDRKTEGLFLQETIAENMLIANIDKVVSRTVVDRKKRTAIATEMGRNLSLKPLIPTMAASNLSGGNQQKVVIGKWLIGNPKLLILDEPTRGIDVGAKTEIYDMIRSLSRSGVTIILLSSEIEELLHISDRILVLRQGRIVEEIDDIQQATQEMILAAALGGK